MPYYIPDLVDKYTCIGNTLSTFNISFSSLDDNLFALSSYSVESINYLSSTMVSVSSTLDSNIDYLSATMVSVSGDLKTQIQYTSSDLKTQIQYTSSDLKTQLFYTSSDLQYQVDTLIDNYTLQGNLYNGADGSTLSWDSSAVGLNATLLLSSNINMDNISGLTPGDSGNLSICINIAGKAITSYGPLWTFNNGISSLTTTLNAENLISYYYNGRYILASLSRNFPTV